MRSLTAFFAISMILALGSSRAMADTLYLTAAATVTNGAASGNLLDNTLSYGTMVTDAAQGTTASASADLSTGVMGVSLAGTVASGYGSISDFAYSFMGDTITPSGPTAGLSLGVNLNVTGTSSFSDPTQNLTFVGVYAFTPGTFDTADFTAPGQVLFSEGFVLGAGTGAYATDFSNFGLTYGGSYGNGPQSIPLNIPFSTLGSNFQVLLSLETYETGSSSTGGTFNVDYSDPLTVSLSAPAGVTLYSASGVLPGTMASAPEPTSLILLASVLFMPLLWRRAARKRA